MSISIEAVGKSGKFKLFKENGEFIMVSQSKIEEVDSDGNMLNSWNLAGSGTYSDPTPATPNEYLVFKEFVADQNGNGNAKFQLYIIFNTSSEISYINKDPYTLQDVTIEPGALKFSIKLSNWSFHEDGDTIRYSITMDDTSQSTIEREENESDSTVVMSLPGGKMVSPTDATIVNQDDSQETVKIRVDQEDSQDNTINFVFDVSTKPKELIYDPEVTLLDETESKTNDTSTSMLPYYITIGVVIVILLLIYLMYRYAK